MTTTTHPPQKPDTFLYHPPDALSAMTLAELEAWWELVPTERQRQYRTIYDQFIRSEGVATSDAAELAALEQLLTHHYAQACRVPVLPKGDHWVRVPQQIREAAEANTAFGDATAHETPPAHPPMLPLLLLLGAGAVVVGLLLWRGWSGRGQATGVSSASVTLTATPRQSPTPTPLALDAQDDIIRGGDAGSTSAFFPVNLRVILADETQPRLFVVQRRLVPTTEWLYEDNPDIANVIAGLTVRPVIGISWSEANAALFAEMRAGTRFVLQMNTGSTMRFTFTDKQTVSRSDTQGFRQTGPGLVVVLIGQRHAETNEPTPTRFLVTADYDVTQELALDGGLAGMTLPPATPFPPTPSATPVQRVDVQLISVTTAPGRLIATLRLYNGRSAALPISADTLTLALGYAANPPGPLLAAAVAPFSLAPGQAADWDCTFPWQGEPFAALAVFDYRFAITVREGNR